MKEKLKPALLFLLCFGYFGLKAQQDVTATGGDATGSGGTASYSVGQITNNANTGSNGNKNQGVQQPFEFFTVGINEHQDINLALSAYPNPAASSLNLKVEKQGFENLSFQLYDLTGKLILSQKISSAETSIPMETLANGNYILKVTDNKSEIKSFQIIKNK
jgi:hypothetical protein